PSSAWERNEPSSAWRMQAVGNCREGQNLSRQAELGSGVPKQSLGTRLISTLMNYYLIIPLFLGFLGVYFLLPRPKPTATLAGMGAIGLAIVLGGVFLLHRMDNWAETILFYCFSGIAILGGVLMLAQKNPVHAALSFALVVLSSCGLFLLN